MKRTTFLGLGAIGAGLVTGCSLIAMGGGPGPRTPPQPITTQIAVSDSGGGCVIAPVGDIRVTKNPLLKWQITPPAMASKYRFPADGITFAAKHGYTLPAAGQFGAGSVDAHGMFVIMDNNTKAGTYAYKVRLVHANGGAEACVLDPTIYNDGSCAADC